MLCPKHSSPSPLFHLHILFRLLQGKHSKKSKNSTCFIYHHLESNATILVLQELIKINKSCFSSLPTPTRIHREGKLCYLNSQSPFYFIYWALILEEELGSVWVLSPALSFEALWTWWLSLQIEFLTPSTTAVCSSSLLSSFSWSSSSFSHSGDSS